MVEFLVVEPSRDQAVPDFWQQLGLPGLFDVHVHFLPQKIQDKVWAQFDQAGPKIGREWPIHYRGTHDERVAQLRALGVRRFSALPYAHRPAVAAYLNDWAADFAARTPDCLRSATFYPEPGVAEFLALAEGYDRVHLDTTMVFTDFFDVEATYPSGLLPRLVDLGDKVLLGSDFPTIPYPYAEQLAGLARLHDRHPGLDEDWLRKVCWRNAVAMFGEPAGNAVESVDVPT